MEPTADCCLGHEVALGECLQSDKFLLSPRMNRITNLRALGTTRARSVSGEGDPTGVTPVFEARLVEGSVTSRESVARRLLQDALLPERRDALERKPRRHRAWVDLEKDCPDIISNGGEDSDVKNGSWRFSG